MKKIVALVLILGLTSLSAVDMAASNTDASVKAEKTIKKAKTEKRVPKYKSQQLYKWELVKLLEGSEELSNIDSFVD